MNTHSAPSRTIGPTTKPNPNQSPHIDSHTPNERTIDQHREFEMRAAFSLLMPFLRRAS